MTNNGPMSQQSGNVQKLPRKHSVWSAEENRKYEEVVTSIWTTEQAKTSENRLAGAHLWDRVSQLLSEQSVMMSARQCRQKIVKLRESKPEFQDMFVFRHLKSRVEQGLAESNNEDDADPDFVEDEDSTSFSDGNMLSDPTGRKHRWSEEERDKLINLVVARRELENRDRTVQILSTKEIWEYVSMQLKEHSFDRSSDSCKGYWKRNITGHFGFGTGVGLETTLRSSTIPVLLSSKQLSASISSGSKSSGKFRFSEEQRAALKIAFRKSASLNAEVKDRLAQDLSLTPMQVSVSFLYANLRFHFRLKLCLRDGLATHGKEYGLSGRNNVVVGMKQLSKRAFRYPGIHKMILSPMRMPYHTKGRPRAMCRYPRQGSASPQIRRWQMIRMTSL